MLFSISCFLAAAWLPALVSTTYCNVGTLHLTPCLLWYMFLYKLFFETLSGSLGFHIVLKNTAVFFLCNPYTEVSCTYCHYCSWCQKYEILLFLCRIWLYGSGDLHCCVADSAIICIYSYTPTLHNSYNGCLVMAKGNKETHRQGSILSRLCVWLHSGFHGYVMWICISFSVFSSELTGSLLLNVKRWNMKWWFFQSGILW